MDTNNIEAIVREILAGIKGGSNVSAPRQSAGAPDRARVAMLVEKERFELQEHKIPEIGDDDILVKVEGCGVCGTDAHEFKNDPFGLIPVVLGHEGTGVKAEQTYTSGSAAIQNVTKYASVTAGDTRLSANKNGNYECSYNNKC